MIYNNNIDYNGYIELYMKYYNDNIISYENNKKYEFENEININKLTTNILNWNNLIYEFNNDIDLNIPIITNKICKCYNDNIDYNCYCVNFRNPKYENFYCWYNIKFN